TINDLEFDLLAFFERAKAGTLNRREVHEHVVAALTFNESVTLRVVEPLDLTGDALTTCLPHEWRRDAPPDDLCRWNRARQSTKQRPLPAVLSRPPARKRQRVTLVGRLRRVNCGVQLQNLVYMRGLLRVSSTHGLGV